MSQNSRQQVIVGMSGGVDSSVSAMLLKQQGYAVSGMFMKNWEEDDRFGTCPAEQDAADAAAVCKKLGAKLYTRNFATEYWDNVFEHFLAEYRAGRTPNPDILCNREIKFKTFLEHAQDLGADTIATGHYVRRGRDRDSWQLLRGLDRNKDQSYFLYTLGQQQLARTLFPIGELEKPEVRNLARASDLHVHQKKDSTGICFIGERDFKAFLSRYIPAQPGEIKSTEGEPLGEHDGLMYYTLGQRQGLGIGGTTKGSGAPWYVVHKDLDTRILYVAQGDDHPLLFSTRLKAGQCSWVNGTAPAASFSCTAKTRYRQPDQSCAVEIQADDTLEVRFNLPQRAVTPGQSVVFYRDEVCLGGAVINTTNTNIRPIILR
jgi:tRNA-specific 2-thiouridylase